MGRKGVLGSKLEYTMNIDLLELYPIDVKDRFISSNPLCVVT